MTSGCRAGSMARGVLAGIIIALPILSSAAELEIQFHNATKGIHFTPLIVAAHGSDVGLFRVGMAATPELRRLAEGGAISGLVSTVINAGGVVVENPAGRLLPGGGNVSFSVDTGSHTHLSLAAMLLPTNDGFVGLDSWTIPTTTVATFGTTCAPAPAEGEEPDPQATPITQSELATVTQSNGRLVVTGARAADEDSGGATINAAACIDGETTLTVVETTTPRAGTYRINLNAYDAGTEANNELIVAGSGALGVAGIPEAPAGNGAVGGRGAAVSEEPAVVRIHPGNIGDTNTLGGISDVDSREHRWLNPVATMIITVLEETRASR